MPTTRKRAAGWRAAISENTRARRSGANSANLVYASTTGSPPEPKLSPGSLAVSLRDHNGDRINREGKVERSASPQARHPPLKLATRDGYLVREPDAPALRHRDRQARDPTEAIGFVLVPAAFTFPVVSIKHNPAVEQPETPCRDRGQQDDRRECLRLEGVDHIRPQSGNLPEHQYREREVARPRAALALACGRLERHQRPCGSQHRVANPKAEERRAGRDQPTRSVARSAARARSSFPWSADRSSRQ